MAYKIIKSIYAIKHIEQVDFKQQSDNDILIGIKFVSGGNVNIHCDDILKAQIRYDELKGLIRDYLENVNN